MIQMQRLQPQLKAIQAKYRDDREKMNQEMLAFYRANNVNPVGGCLPMLIQIPVFLVLYRVVNGLTARWTDIGFSGGYNSLRLRLGELSGNFAFGHAPDSVTSKADYFNPAYLSKDSELYQDLSRATEMKSWGIDLSESASKALGEGFTHALPYLVLIALVLVTGVIQQRQIQGRQAKSGSTSPINSQQQMIMKIMPFFLPVFSFGVPAALVVYFLVSNCWRIGQQAFITRTLYSGHHAPAAPIEAVVVDEAPAPVKNATSTKSGRASAKSANSTASGDSSRSTRSPMGRNRRADGEATEPSVRRARPAPKPKPKPKPAPTNSGRVTPPGTGARKKKTT
jgi:YidC/Oxa1 family membrane protein insertase